MAKQGRSQEFQAEFDRLYTKGDFVQLVAGGNFMLDELYLFERATDAEEFYKVGFIGRESIIDDRPCGFQGICLYRSGELIATKAQPPSGEQGIAVAHEQSNKEVTSTDAALEGEDSDL
jgi:hypothetical protein